MKQSTKDTLVELGIYVGTAACAGLIAYFSCSIGYKMGAKDTEIKWLSSIAEGALTDSATNGQQTTVTKF